MNKKSSRTDMEGSAKNEEPNSERPPILTRVGLLPFLIILAGITVVLFLRFSFKFSEDLFNNGLDFLTIIKLIVLGSSFFFLVSLAYPIALGTALLYSRLSKESNSILKALQLDFSVVTTFCVLIFGYAAFIQPKVNLSFGALMYDVQVKGPGDTLHRTNIDFFKDVPQTKNIIDLVTSNRAEMKKIDSNKTELMDALKSKSSPKRLDSFLAYTDLSTVGLTVDDVKSHQTNWEGGFEYPMSNLSTLVLLAEKKIKRNKKQIKQNSREIWRMFFTPLSLLLLFILSAQFGMNRYRKNKSATIVASFIGVCTWLYLVRFIEDFIKKDIISLSIGNLGLLLLLMVFNLIFFNRTRRVIQITEPKDELDY